MIPASRRAWSMLAEHVERITRTGCTRVYVSTDDHRTLYLYFDSVSVVAPSQGRRDQLRVNGVPIVWRTGYAGPPTADDPDPSQPDGGGPR